MGYIKQADWKEFEAKYAGKCEKALEALCRYLFKARFGIEDNLPYFHNHPGIETSPIQVGDDLIGFQSKFFDTKIEADRIITSMETAASTYPTLTKYIVYTNKEFSLNKKKQKPAAQVQIEAEAERHGWDLIWYYGDNIIDAVGRIPFLYHLFFDMASHLRYLHEDVQDMNETRFRDIQTEIRIKETPFYIKREQELERLESFIQRGHHVLISGEGGCGKSALIKKYYEAHREDDDYALYILNAGQLNVSGVNEFFRLKHDYILPDIIHFYQGCKHKVLFVDSAERMADVIRTDNVSQLFEALREAGWVLVFTCRDNGSESLKNALLQTYHVEVEEITIETLKNEVLISFLSDHQMTVPQDKKLLDRITNPFYLARYVNLSNDVHTIEQFREAIWNSKIKGIQAGPIQRRREQCFERLVREQENTNSYIVGNAEPDAEALYALKADEVIGEIPHYGYYICHDLYADWALDYIIGRELQTIDDIERLMTEEKPFSYVNAVKRFLITLLNEHRDHETINVFLESVFKTATHRRWRFAILEGVALSDNYSEIFFERYKERLEQDENGIFRLFTDVLCTSCKTRRYPDPVLRPNFTERIPIGSGWGAAIRFIDAHRNLKVNLLRLLGDYSPCASDDLKIGQIAGQIAIDVFEEAETGNMNGVWSYIKDADEWSRVVCRYAIPMYSQLKKVFADIIERGNLPRREGYYDLVEYIVTKGSVNDLFTLCIAHQEKILQLLDLVWKEQGEVKPYIEDVNPHSVEERVFGLNIKDRTFVEYETASAYQTPILPLLYADALQKKTAALDYVIQFVDYCTEKYKSRSPYSNPIVEIDFEKDGEHHRVIASEPLWHMYRGESGHPTPILLQCVLMALEKYLLELSEGGYGKENTKVLLEYILTKSHSAAIYAVVASVAMSDFNAYADILYYVVQDVRCIVYDRHRGVVETNVSTNPYFYSANSLYAKERQESNKLRHRGMNLEMWFQMAQISCFSGEGFVSDEEIRRMEWTRDKLQKQVAAMPNKTCEDYIIEHTDYRNMTKTDFSSPDGSRGSQYIVNLSPNLQDRLDEIIESNRKMLRGVYMMAWVQAKFLNDDEEERKNTYYGNLGLLLEHLRWAEEMIKEGKGSILFGADVYLPCYIKAMLLEYHYDELEPEFRKECITEVLDTLQTADLIKAPLARFDIVLTVIPTLIKRNCELVETLSDILIQYASSTYPYNTRVPYRCVYFLVSLYKLWDVYPHFMQRTLTKYLKQKEFVIGKTLSLEESLTILSLLGRSPADRLLGSHCVERLADVWNPSRKDSYVYMYKSHVASICADYILRAPIEEVDDLIKNYVANICTILEKCSWFDAFVRVAAQSKQYDNFWKVWDLLYPAIKENFPSARVMSLNSYLIGQWVDTNRGWGNFVVDRRVVRFYDIVVDDFSAHSSVGFAIIKNVCFMTDEYQLEMLPVVTKAVENIVIANSLHPDFLLFADIYVEKLNAVHRDTIRRDSTKNGQYVRLLEYMRDLGSNVAAELL